ASAWLSPRPCAEPQSTPRAAMAGPRRHPADGSAHLAPAAVAPRHGLRFLEPRRRRPLAAADERRAGLLRLGGDGHAAAELVLPLGPSERVGSLFPLRHEQPRLHARPALLSLLRGATPGPRGAEPGLGLGLRGARRPDGPLRLAGGWRGTRGDGRYCASRS